MGPKRKPGRPPLSLAVTSPRSFYKIMLPSIIHDFKMRIPKAFAKQHEIDLSTFASLTVPSGQVFHVRVEKADKMLWFHDGWKEFAEHHSIRCGFFLVFDYEGNSNFKVHIFDLSGAEIQYPKNALGICEEPNYGRKQRVSAKREKELGGPLRSPYSVTSRPHPLSSQNEGFSECLLRGVKRKRCFHSLLPILFVFAPEFAMRINKCGRCISSLDGWRSNFKYLTRNKQCKVENLGEMTKLECVNTHKGTPVASGVPNSGMKPEKDELSPRNDEHLARKFSVLSGSELQNHTNVAEKKIQRLAEDSVYVLSTTQLNKDNIRQVKVKQEEGVELPGSNSSRSPKRSTIKEKEKAIFAASMLELKNLHFMIVLKQYNVERCFILNVPASFAEHLASSSRNLKLQDSEGKQWPVACALSNGKVRSLSWGWMTFVKDNNLMVGDVCIFELIQVGEVVLKVHIFRTRQTSLMKPAVIYF